MKTAIIGSYIGVCLYGSIAFMLCLASGAWLSALFIRTGFNPLLCLPAVWLSVAVAHTLYQRVVNKTYVLGYKDGYYDGDLQAIDEIQDLIDKKMPIRIERRRNERD